VNPQQNERRSFRYYEFVMAAFVTVLICSNLIGPAKIVQVDWLPFVFGAGVLFFPVSYVFGDVLTEVYGYARARRVIWAGFGGLAFASFMASVVVALPPASFWENQKAYEIAFGTTWRIALASMFAYFWQVAVDAHHRLDRRRRGGGFGAVLPARVLQLGPDPER
jgi:queuosine precursor transporter